MTHILYPSSPYDSNFAYHRDVHAMMRTWERCISFEPSHEHGCHPKHSDQAIQMLHRRLDRIRCATPGCLDDAIYKASFCAGSLVSVGLISKKDCDGALQSQARKVGHSGSNVKPLIRNGLQGGRFALLDSGFSQ